MKDLRRALFIHLCGKGIFFDEKIGEKTQVFVDRDGRKFIWLHQLDNPVQLHPIVYRENNQVVRGIYHILFDNYYSFWIDEKGNVTGRRESPLPDDPYFHFSIAEVTVKDGNITWGNPADFSENDCPEHLKETFQRQVKYWLDKALAVKVNPDNVFKEK